MAEALAGAGSDVVIWGTNAGKNAAACQTLEVHSGRVIVAPVDVSNEAALTAGIGDAVRRFGRLDFVAANVANTGIGRHSASFADISTEDWHIVMAVNLNGVFWTLRVACRHMAERSERGDRGGSLLAVSSTSAIHGAPTNQAYAASKGAPLSLIRRIAVE